ncbi:hypothetical protein Gohar_005233, partial [Gossypium harknessii]|nr:hypothetical protein [Gossypium harknessii]
MASATCSIFFSSSLSFPKLSSHSSDYKLITSLPFFCSFSPISSLKLSHHSLPVLPNRAFRVLASDSTTDPHENTASSGAAIGCGAVRLVYFFVYSIVTISNLTATAVFTLTA